MLSVINPIPSHPAAGQMFDILLASVAPIATFCGSSARRRRMFGNIGTPTRVQLSEALVRSGPTWSRSMTKFTLLGVATILSTALAPPVLAQAVIQEPGAYAFYHPNVDLRIGPTPLQRREEVIAGRGTADAMALTSFFRPPRAGKETTTRPWLAPVGHRQPHAADVLTSTSVSQYVLDQEEDANVDRKISGVCRGC
jgi:hypothetical protein